MNQFVLGTSNKSRRTALILCVLFGVFGAHHFYVGRYGKGILYLCTFGLCWAGWFMDVVRIISGDYTDKYGNYLTELNGCIQNSQYIQPMQGYPVNQPMQNMQSQPYNPQMKNQQFPQNNTTQQ